MRNLLLGTTAAVVFLMVFSHAQADTWTDTITGLSPTGWWRLNEATGGTAFDSAGSNHGAYTGGPVLDQDAAFSNPVNRSVNFVRAAHDSGDHVDLGDVLDMGTQSFTVLAWFNATAASDDDDWYKIINKGQTSAGTPQNAGYAIRLREGELETRVIDAASNAVRTAVAEPTLNEWHFVAMVLDRTASELRMYLDPTDTSASDTAAYVSLGSLDTNIPLAIGALERGAFDVDSEFFDGFIDEVVIFDTALSGQDVLDAYQSVPEPASMLTLILGTICLARRRCA